MRVFKGKVFDRFARKAGISNTTLSGAIYDAALGLVDADLGGGVIKLRLARPGGGKSGGYRSIVLFRARERAVFMYGFAKNERDNIGTDELVAFRKLARAVLAYGDDELAAALATGALIEVIDD